MDLRVLIVEDSEDDAALVQRELTRAGYAVHRQRVETETALRAALGAPWDLVIGDYNIPGFSGIAALAIVREIDSDLPFIFVSGTIGEDVAVSAMRAGAQDYVMKGNLKRLTPAIERELREAATRRERRRLDAQFRQIQRLEAVGRLAGGVAHDFNNLLTVMMGCAEMIMKDLPADDPRYADAFEIQRAAERGAALTHQLLAFSRRQVLEARAVDLNAIVSGMEPMLHRLIGEDIEISTSLDRDSGLVWADPGQLEQVIMNLVVNARDAMPTGGLLTIETAQARFDDGYVRQHPPARAGDYVMLAISDNGIGMDEHVRGHIFDPFFTTKEVGKGTGLGLATVYGIVKQTDGFIWVYSEPGKGSTFKVYLPRTEDVAEIARPAGEPESLEGAETILLVEDDESIRRLMRESLRDLGYAVHEAADGQAAIEVAAAMGEIDLLVTDVVMPRMSGRELATSLATKHPMLAVLYMSGYTDDTVIRHGVLEAGSAYLQKPFNLEALARKIRVVLGARPRSERC